MESSTTLTCKGFAENARVDLTVTIQYRPDKSQAWRKVSVNLGIGYIKDGKLRMTVSASMFCKKGTNEYQAVAAARVHKSRASGGIGIPISEGPWSTLKCPNGV